MTRPHINEVLWDFFDKKEWYSVPQAVQMLLDNLEDNNLEIIEKKVMLNTTVEP